MAAGLAAPCICSATAETLARGAAASKILRDQGVVVEAITPGRVAELDPVYAAVKDRFAGALYAPGDESGDARMFTRGLAEWLVQRGVELRLGRGHHPHPRRR